MIVRKDGPARAPSGAALRGKRAGDAFLAGNPLPPSSEGQFRWHQPIVNPVNRRSRATSAASLSARAQLAPRLHAPELTY